MCAALQISIFGGFSSLCVSICRFVHIENVSLCIFKQFSALYCPSTLPASFATIKFIHGFIVSPYCSALRNAFFMNEKLENWQFPAPLRSRRANFPSVAVRKNFYVRFRNILFACRTIKSFPIENFAFSSSCGRTSREENIHKTTDTNWIIFEFRSTNFLRKFVNCTTSQLLSLGS